MLARRLIALACLALLSFGCEALLGLEDSYVVGNVAAVDGDVVGDGSVGQGDGSGSDAAVLHAPLAFDPPMIELALDASAPFTVRLTDSVPEDVHLTFSVARERLGPPGAPPPPAGAAPTVDPPTVTLTATNSQASLTVHAGADLLTAPFTVTASAATADGVDLGTAALSVHVLGHPGDLDTSFGQRGFFDFDPSGTCKAEDVIVLPDHRFYVIGTANTDAALFVARFYPDGSLDPAYASGGKAVLTPKDTTVSFERMKAALLPDGSLVVATGADQNAVLVHVLADGTLDDGWGGPDAGSVIRTGIFEGIERNYGYVPIVTRPTGEILVGGTNLTFSSNNMGLVEQLRPDGSVDPSFGTAGKAPATFDDYSAVRALALQPNGNLMVAGQGIVYVDGGNNQYDEYFTLLTPTGASAGQTASRRYPQAPPGQEPATAFSGVTAMAAQADGGALIGAYNVYFVGPREWGVLHVAGSTMSAFPDVDSGNPDGTVGTILVLPDGTFIINDGNYAGTQFYIAKFHSDGTPDTTFGTGGLATSIPQLAYALALDDRLMYAVGVADASSARIARYWAR